MKKSQIFVICGGLLLVVLIFLAPHTTDVVAPAMAEAVDEKPSLEKAIQLVNSPQPMQGIMMLRKLLDEDPNNVDVHYQLGLFSVQSRQLDKAVNRFIKVYELDSTRVNALYDLGTVYAQMGENEKAIETLEKYQSKLSDEGSVNEIKEIIKKLKL